jgi:hypothetical protein
MASLHSPLCKPTRTLPIANISSCLPNILDAIAICPRICSITTSYLISSLTFLPNSLGQQLLVYTRKINYSRCTHNMPTTPPNSPGNLSPKSPTPTPPSSCPSAIRIIRVTEGGVQTFRACPWVGRSEAATRIRGMNLNVLDRKFEMEWGVR